LEKKDTQDVIAGVKEIAKILVEAKTGIADCKAVTGDFKKLEAMAAIFASPESFEIHVGKDLVINGRSIFAEVTTAVADYKKADFEGFGENIGEAAAKTILGAEKL
jgi:hypothetical protein